MQAMSKVKEKFSGPFHRPLQHPPSQNMMFRPSNIALGVLLLAGTAAGKCSQKCMPQNCLTTDETTLANAVNAHLQALTNLKNTEPVLRQTVGKAKTALANAKTNLTTAQQAKTHADGAVDAQSQMLTQATNDYKGAQAAWTKITDSCTGKTGQGASFAPAFLHQ